MTALREHLSDEPIAHPDAVRERAGLIADPNVWSAADAAAHPQLDPAWVTRVSHALGKLEDSGVELSGFLAAGGLAAVVASLDLPLPPDRTGPTG